VYSKLCFTHIFWNRSVNVAIGKLLIVGRGKKGIGAEKKRGE
jgi:hypothetical protein